MPSIPRRGYIYFILDRTAGAIKIGFSKDVKSRLSALQVSSATKLELLGSMPGTEREEQRLHLRFERLSGEWFTVTHKLLDFIGNHASTTNEYRTIMAQAQPTTAQIEAPAKVAHRPQPSAFDTSTQRHWKPISPP